MTMNRDHDLHHDHNDERIRVSNVARHEQAVREHERRRVLATVAKLHDDEDEDPDFPGCYW